MNRISLEEYIKSKQDNQDYDKCLCGSKKRKGNELCSKCKFKPCKISSCDKFLIKDSKYDICYDCHLKVKEILVNC